MIWANPSPFQAPEFLPRRALPRLPGVTWAPWWLFGANTSCSANPSSPGLVDYPS